MPGTTDPLGGTQGFAAKLQAIITRLVNLETWQRSISGGTDDPTTSWLLPSGGDDTAALNLAAATSRPLGPGAFIVNGIVNVPQPGSLGGVGSGATILQLGPSGQITDGLVGTPPAYGAGLLGGFTITGADIQSATKGALYLAGGNYRLYHDIVVRDCASDLCVMEEMQNCTFIDCRFEAAGRSCFVFDLGTGGNSFVGCHFGGAKKYNIEFRQSGPSGGYGQILGPSANQFFGCIMEYAWTGNEAMVYHGAGENNHFYDCGLSATPVSIATLPASVVVGECAANAVATTATYSTSSNTMTITGSTANIGDFMTVSGPGIIPGTVMTISGSTVTLTTVPLSNETNVAVSFGAVSRLVGFTGCTFLGPTGSGLGTACIDLRGGVSVSIDGPAVFEGTNQVFLMTSNDQVQMGVGLLTNFVSTWATAQAGDTIDPATQIQNHSNAPYVVATQAAPHSGFYQVREGDTDVNLQTVLGGILFSDGTFPPTTSVGVTYAHDSNGNPVVEILPAVMSPLLGVSGLAAFTLPSRFLGFYDAAGPPGLFSTIDTGDWLIDVDGVVWLATLGGLSGTWVGGGTAVSWTALTPTGNVVALPGAQSPRFQKDAQGFVVLDGDLETTAPYTANTAFFTSPLPVGSRPLLPKFFAFASGAVAGFILIDSTGVISLDVSLGSAGLFIMLDGIRFPTS